MRKKRHWSDLLLTPWQVKARPRQGACKSQVPAWCLFHSPANKETLQLLLAPLHLRAGGGPAAQPPCQSPSGSEPREAQNCSTAHRGATDDLHSKERGAYQTSYNSHYCENVSVKACEGMRSMWHTHEKHGDKDTGVVTARWVQWCQLCFSLTWNALPLFCKRDFGTDL